MLHELAIGKSNSHESYSVSLASCTCPAAHVSMTGTILSKLIRCHRRLNEIFTENSPSL